LLSKLNCRLSMLQPMVGRKLLRLWRKMWTPSSSQN
jgi:hypothetical protein